WPGDTRDARDPHRGRQEDAEARVLPLLLREGPVGIRSGGTRQFFLRKYPAKSTQRHARRCVRGGWGRERATVAVPIAVPPRRLLPPPPPRIRSAAPPVGGGIMKYQSAEKRLRTRWRLPCASVVIAWVGVR